MVRPKDHIRLFILAVIYFFIMSSILGCRSKKKTVERTIIQDTLKTVRLESKTKPIDVNYKFDLVCDSLGNVRPVSFQEASGDNTAKLKIINNQLLAQLKVAESKSKIDTIYKTKYKNHYIDRELVKYRTPFWVWTVFIILVLLLILSNLRWIRKILLPLS